MIITRLTGGLGNQMFQYAAGLALAERRRTVLKLNVSWFREYKEYESHNRYALSCFNITEQFATELEIEQFRAPRLTRTERWGVSLARVLHLRDHVQRNSRPDRWHIPSTFAYYPAFESLPDGISLDGMFQSEQFFAPIADLLRLHFSFRYPPSGAVAEIATRIRSGPSAFVHFRRGDYARNSAFSSEMGVVGPAYYQNAVDRLRAEHPNITLYVFSDDIDAVEREFAPGGKVVFVRATTHTNSYDKIRLMALCDHGIVANSTFSWWGAWLNPSPDRLVIAPDPWFDQSAHDTRDLVPASWTKLPRGA